MVVEFLGLPGTGKSTLAWLVAEALVARHLVVENASGELVHDLGPARRWLRKAGHVLEALVREPARSARAVRAILGTRQASVGDLLSTTLNWLLVTRLARRASGSRQIVLLDQGIAQALWSIAQSARGRDWETAMDQAARLAPMPDMVVVVAAAPDDIASRLATRRRGRSRLTAAHASDPERMARASAHVEAVTDLMRRRRVPMAMIINDDRQQLALNTALITQQIMCTLERLPSIDRTTEEERHQQSSTFKITHHHS